MKHLSILELAEELEFKQTDSGSMGAYLFGELIGECEREALVPPEAMKAWKNEALRRVSHLSTTVVLRTACKCERYIDGVRMGTPSWKIPISKPSSIITFNSDSMIGVYREFKFTGKTDEETGFRVYEEVAR
jgi:hypothetical protein